jgi:hypothetical protein
MRAVGTHNGPTRIIRSSSGLQATPGMLLEGRHSWHSGAHSTLLSSPGRATVGDDNDYGPGGPQWPLGPPSHRCYSISSGPMIWPLGGGTGPVAGGTGWTGVE